MCELGDKEPGNLFSEIVVIWLNVHVQSECSCKTTLYLFVRNSSSASGISVLRIQLKLGVIMSLTKLELDLRETRKFLLQ